MHEGHFEDQPVLGVPHPNALLTRCEGGVQVDACYMPITDLTGIAVRTLEESRWVSVERERLLDAFHHPALYLTPEACEALELR